MMLRWRFFWGLMLGHVALATSFLVPVHGAALAHEKWFVEEGQHAGERASIETNTLLAVLAAMALALVALVVHRAKLRPIIDSILDKKRDSLPRGIEWRVVAVLAGIMLVAIALQGSFLAPEQVLPNPGLVLVGRLIQIAIGLLLISQLSFFLAGLLIASILVPLAALFFAPDFLIDYGFEYISLAVAFAFVGLSSTCPDRFALWARVKVRREAEDFSHLPSRTIRIGLGLTFIVLALHYKLLDQNVALTFLDKHDLNFMPYLGFSGFTNLHFVFAAGVAEVTFGLLLVSGIATRLVSAGLLLFFLTTLIVLGPIELVGHLPIMGILLLLLYRKPRAFASVRRPAPRVSYG